MWSVFLWQDPQNPQKASGAWKALCKSGSRKSLDVDEGEWAKGSRGHCVGTGSRPCRWGAPWAGPHSPQALRELHRATMGQSKNLIPGCLQNKGQSLASWDLGAGSIKRGLQRALAMCYLTLLSTVDRKFHAWAPS